MVFSRLIKSGDEELKQNLVTHEFVEDDEFGRHVFSEEGELAVDVYQTAIHLVVVAPLAGVEAEDLDVRISDKEVLTIIGIRHHVDEVDEEDFLTQECFWGSFSRSIVLPEGLDTDSVEAKFRRGVLRVEIPKIKKEKQKKIKIQE